jgi:hypothetical protein
MGTEGPSAWTRERIAQLTPRLRAEFAGEGFTSDEAAHAASKVQAILKATLGDERGRWLFDPTHAEARSEWPLAGVERDAVAHVVLDRTFVADGIRWIVDFKTGGHEGGDVAAFLDREVERYRLQLTRYGRLVRALDPERPIRLALYYPLVPGGFRAWAFDG